MPSIFLSYASEDREAARVLRDELTSLGLDAWYDESELGGGEAWDQKIRRKIRECDYFMPLISKQTEARLEGYFRREWRFAVERTLDMADDHLFLLPIVLDDVNTSAARVPEKFFSVQWLKVPGGRPTPALEALCRRLAAGNAKALEPDLPAAPRVDKPPPPITPPPGPPPPVTPPPTALPILPFPREEPGQRVQFWAHVLVWAGLSVWSLFRRLPRWVQWMCYGWLVIAFFSHPNSSRHHESPDLSAAQMEKLKALTNNDSGSVNKDALVKFGVQIAKQVADEDEAASGKPLLIVPFSAPESDSPGEEFADAVFSTVHAQVVKLHHGEVSLSDEPSSSQDVHAAVELGRTSHAQYVVDGWAEAKDKGQTLTVRVISVTAEKVVWSKSYPQGADAANIAADVNAKIPALEK